MATAREAALSCRAALEIAWPLWRDSCGIPPAPAGAPPSDRCCIYSAFLLEWFLNERVPGVAWRAVGGLPTERSPRGGCADASGESWQHLWVVGASHALPGDPLVLADVTADQFGGPPVLLERLPHPRFRANQPPAAVEALRDHERSLVETLRVLVAETDRLRRRSPG